MKLVVTVGNDNGDNEELVFDVPEPITWLGVEIPTSGNGYDTNGLDRLTILRIPFHTHGQTIHTTCQLNGDIQILPQ